MPEEKKEQTPEEKKQATALVEYKSVADSVLARVKSLQGDKALVLPDNYSAANALKSAWLILQNTKDKNQTPVLQSCTKESVANALLDMVVQGLNPVKKQCYFIAYGNQLTCDRGYFGDVATMRRVTEIIDITYQVVRKDEKFEFTITDGTRNITKHESTIETLDNPIIAAYCIITTKSRDMKVLTYTKIMTIKQIHQAWRQSKNSPFIGDTDKMNEKSPHYKFAEEFCLKTVIAGAAKFIINTSDDSDLALAEAINKETAGDLTNAAPDGVVIDAAAVASDTAPEPEPKEEPNPGAAIGSSNLHPIEGAPVEGDGLFAPKKKARF